MEHISKIAFPGLGIGQFELSNVAFDVADIFALFGIKIDSFPVYWYGIIITCGIVLAFLYACYRGKYESVKSDDVMDIALWTVIIGVIGARLYFVLTKLDSFLPKGEFNLVEFVKNVINLRQGGLAIYGGIIAGASTIIVVTCIKKINFLKLWDMAGPGVMIAQSLGRWGNFFNGEAYGGLVNEGHPLNFMRMSLESYNTRHDEVLAEALGAYPIGSVNVHPTFLYESLWNLVGFILINIFYKKKKFNGQMACMYLAWYGFGRFFIESLRTDSLYVPGTAIRVSQMVGLLCFVVFGSALVAGLIYSRKKLTVAGASLNKFDQYLLPCLVANPVFFEKKAKDNKTDANEKINEEISNEGVEQPVDETENAEEPVEENAIEPTEDSENGTDN